MVAWLCPNAPVATLMDTGEQITRIYMEWWLKPNQTNKANQNQNSIVLYPYTYGECNMKPLQFLEPVSTNLVKTIVWQA